MNNTIKKSIKYISYAFVLAAATAIALLPFLRKDKEFTMNYSPEVRDAMADIPAVQQQGGVTAMMMMMVALFSIY